MIKQIIFDCGGVFVDIQFLQLMQQLTGSPEKAQDFYDKLFLADSPWLKYDRGLCDTEEVYHLLRACLPEEDHMALRAFMDQWPHWLPTFPGMENIIDQLHEAGYKCYLLSNFSHRFEEFLPLCPALAHLDGKVISYQVKMSKPQREIFDHAAKTFGILPEETLFVDDTERNVQSAREAGFQAYHFQTPRNCAPTCIHWGF